MDIPYIPEASADWKRRRPVGRVRFAALSNDTEHVYWLDAEERPQARITVPNLQAAACKGR